MVDIVENQPLLDLPNPQSVPYLTDKHLAHYLPKFITRLEHSLRVGQVFSASYAEEFFRGPLSIETPLHHNFNKGGFHYQVDTRIFGLSRDRAYGLKRVYIGDKKIDEKQELWQEELALIPQTAGTTNNFPSLPGWGVEYVFNKATRETKNGDYDLSSTSFTNREVAEARLLIIINDIRTRSSLKLMPKMVAAA